MRILIDFCFRRPISVTAVYILLLVLAVVAYVRLPVALLPELRYPSLIVWTDYPDVPPERVEQTVTVPVEAAVAGTGGLLHLTSRSLLGGSLVRLDFGWNTDLDFALLDVREQLDRLGDVLPDEAERPVVLRLDPSDRPIMMIAMRGEAEEGHKALPATISVLTVPPDGGDLASPHHELARLKEIAREVVARRLEQLRDVARVRTTGGFERQIEIEVDAGRVAAHGLTVEAIASALRAGNVALTGGVIRRGPFSYAVEVSGEFRNLDDIASVIVTWMGTAAIRLSDVARVSESVEDRRGLVRLDGEETLLLLVERRPEANTIRAAEEARAALDELNAELTGVKLDVVVDESVFVQEAIDGVGEALWQGGLLAIFVLYAFVRRTRAVFTVGVAVPLSLAITFILFELFGVTFNLISLGGLALGVGMLIDNAIVVVENISRLRELGQGPVEAARRGTLEVAGAITASTLTTIAVFFPITFVEGLAGRLFRDQSLAVVFSLLASIFVALTAVPLLASRERTQEAPGGKSLRGSRLLRGYERALAWCLGHRSAVVAASAVLLVMTGLLAWKLPREVLPRADQGRVELHLTLPADADLELVDARAAVIESDLRRRGLVRRVLADLGERDEARLDLDPRPPYEGDLVLFLPGDVRAEEVLARAASLNGAPDVTIEVRRVLTQLEELLSAGEADLFVDLVSEQREDAEVYVDALLSRLAARPELASVRRADVENVPAYRLRFRREEMARFGMTSQAVTSYLEAAARGRHATELRTTSDEVPIVVRARGIDSMERLLAESVPTPKGLLPLGLFLDATEVELPAALGRTGQTPVVRLLADIAQGADLAAAATAVEASFAATLPARVRGQIGGANEAFRTSLRAVLWSLLLSLLLVYLILAAEFESLLQPFVVLSAVPLATTGVVIVLWLAGQSINLMSLTGCVVLVGIVDNDAVVMISYINQRREAGLTLREAVLAAGRDRVRPILMTTVTTVLGVLPLALGLGEGGELRAPLAIVIAGGLTSATLLTLFVIPVLYTLSTREEDNDLRAAT